MRLNLFSFSFFLLLLITMPGFSQTALPTAKFSYFNLYIYQDGKLIEPKLELKGIQENSIFHLAKKHFTIYFKLNEENLVFINFSKDAKLFNLLAMASSLEATINNALPFTGRELAEKDENQDKAIFITNKGWHCWHVPLGDYLATFDIVSYQEKDNYFICGRTVENIFDADTNKLVSIAKTTVKTIYVVCCFSNFDYQLVSNLNFIIIFDK